MLREHVRFNSELEHLEVSTDRLPAPSPSTRSARESAHHACPQARSNARAQRRASLRAADCIQGEFVNKDKPAYRKRKPEERRSKKDQVVQAQSSANSEAARSCAGSQPSRKRDSVELGSNASAALSLSLRLSLRKSVRSRSSCPSLRPSLGTSGTADTEAEPGAQGLDPTAAVAPVEAGQIRLASVGDEETNSRVGDADRTEASGRPQEEHAATTDEPALQQSDSTDQATVPCTVQASSLPPDEQTTRSASGVAELQESEPWWAR